VNEILKGHPQEVPVTTTTVEQERTRKSNLIGRTNCGQDDYDLVVDFLKITTDKKRHDKEFDSHIRLLLNIKNSNWS
jgi:hypothetical protein